MHANAINGKVIIGLKYMRNILPLSVSNHCKEIDCSVPNIVKKYHFYPNKSQVFPNCTLRSLSIFIFEPSNVTSIKHVNIMLLFYADF